MTAEVLATGIDGWESDFTLSFAICVAAFATWGITQLMNRNVDLLLAEEENARLAVEPRSATGSPATCTTSSATR